MAKEGGFFHRLIVGKDKAEGFARASLPSNRWELFWDIFKGRFWKLIILNLMMVVAFLPVLILLVIRTMGQSYIGSSLPYSNFLGPGYFVVPQIELYGVQQATSLNLQIAIYMIPALMFAGAVLSGEFYILRNMVWTEGIFVANDYWKGLKDNILHFVLIGLFDGIILLLCTFTTNSVTLLEYAGEGNFFLSLSRVMVIVLTVFLMIMSFYMMTLTVTYKLSFFKLIRNSFILTLGLLPQNLFFAVLCLSPLLLVMLIPALTGFGFIIYLIIGFSAAGLGWTTFSHWVFDKFINDKVEGAVKNRGIYQKVDLQGQPVQKRVRTSKLVRKKPLKPVNDEEELLELPQSFTRADLQKLAEQKARMAEEAERWSEEHADDPDIIREDVEYIDGEDESFADAEDAARLEGGTLEDLGSVTAKGAPLPPSQPKKKKDRKHKKDEAAKDEENK